MRAILSDFDVSNPEQLRAARNLLGPLKASAAAPDTVDFDPSGTSGQDRHASPDKNTDGTHSLSGETDITELSNVASLLSLESSVSDEGSSALDDYEKQDVQAKEAQLMELFPTEKAGDIKYTLRKCDGSFTKAMDILLNQVFFKSEDEAGNGGVPLRGVDAFAEEHIVGYKKKGPRQRRKFQPLEGHYESENRGPPGAARTPNKWASAEEDITFIVSRTNVERKTVSSTYHQNGASKKATILSLIQQDITRNADNKTFDDLILDPGVLDFSASYPSLSVTYAAAVLRLTNNSSTKAHDLAKVLTASSNPSGTSTPPRIIPQYTPYKDPSATSKPSTPFPRSTFPSERPSTPPTYNGITTTASVASLTAARSTAFAKASMYHRKANSDNMMSAAAVYYSQLGRDSHTSLLSASAAEADALVISQSSPTQLDLHGVGVKDAVRIASGKVRQWWEGSEERRARARGGKNGIGDGYRIITGLGRHSKGGRARVGPAVCRKLVEEGWKVEVGSGVLTVIGKG